MSDVPAPPRARRMRPDRVRTLYAAFFLVFLGFPLVFAWSLEPVQRWTAISAVVMFAAWYVMGLLAAESHRPAWVAWMRLWQWVGGLLLLIAVVTLCLGDQALVMIVYLATALAGAIRGRRGLLLVLACGLTHLGLALLLGMSPPWAAGVSVWIVIIGGMVWGSVQMDRAQELLTREREQNAELAVDLERTRLARDLHDILGHTLTVVTVKAQLAGRLVDADPERAKSEIGEIERLARDALTDVRLTVRSYRSLSLSAELAGARRALESAEIQAEVPGAAEVVLTEFRELFAWVVREGVTNVVRHSGAKSAVILLSEDVVEIRDDGVGMSSDHARGNGLIGLAERARQAGAHLHVGPGRDGRGVVLRVAAIKTGDRR